MHRVHRGRWGPPRGAAEGHAARAVQPVAAQRLIGRFTGRLEV
ncbi:hypothetical protein [Truepera radiovictrix]|nr:hypothetical protein [Truepera radiovictrix]